MSKININNQKLTENLLVQWLDKLRYLSDIKKQKLYNMACDYYNDISLLYKINKTVANKGKFCKDEM